MFLLDTNIVSELRKPKPNVGLLDWMQQTPSEGLFLSVITLGEIQKGIDLKKAKDPEFKADRLEEWLFQLSRLYKDRILPIDINIAQTWGEIMAINQRHAIDGLIAATAIVHRLSIVTRNEKDFLDWPVDIVNPFRDEVC